MLSSTATVLSFTISCRAASLAALQVLISKYHIDQAMTSHDWFPFSILPSLHGIVLLAALF